MKLYVGNLRWSVTDQQLHDLFARYGKVESAEVVRDQATNRSRGFGFVKMSDPDGQVAIEELDGQLLYARALVISRARERNDRNRSNDRG